MSNTDPNEKTTLEEAIDELIVVMRQTSEDTDEYAKMADQLVKLHKLKIEERKLDAETRAKSRQDDLAEAQHEHAIVQDETRSFRGVSRDTWATIGANVAIVVMVVGHERANVIGTKALNFILKTR